jgi:hypothetical protein
MLARLAPLLLLAAPLFVACAGAPPAVLEAKSLRISYYDFRTEHALILVSAGDPGYRDLYSKAKQDANVKLAEEAELREIVRQAADAGFFEHSGGFDGPAAITVDNPYRMVVIHADGRPHSLLLAKGIGAAQPEIVEVFNEVQRIFVDRFNAIHSLQWVDPGEGEGNFFEREKERIAEENRRRGGGSP